MDRDDVVFPKLISISLERELLQRKKGTQKKNSKNSRPLHSLSNALQGDYDIKKIAIE